MFLVFVCCGPGQDHKNISLHNRPRQAVFLFRVVAYCL